MTFPDFQIAQFKKDFGQSYKGSGQQFPEKPTIKNKQQQIKRKSKNALPIFLKHQRPILKQKLTIEGSLKEHPVLKGKRGVVKE